MQVINCLIEEILLVTSKKGYSMEKIDVNVFDHTSEATLTLWGSVAPSASTWQASQTILLLTNAGFREGQRNIILIDSKTHVDVDPCIAEASWLQDYAQRLIKREHVNIPFPDNGMMAYEGENIVLIPIFSVFDVDAFITTEQRMLFTLADIEDL